MLTKTRYKHEFESRAQSQDADDENRQRRRDQHHAEPGLGFLITFREGGDQRHNRRAKQDEGREQEERNDDGTRC